MAWAGKVVLVTGSTSGIGQATALLFARHGAKTMLHGQSSERLARALDSFKQAKIDASSHHHLLGPIDDESFQKTLIDETIKKFGRLDVLVSNAGVANLHGKKSDSVETLDHVMRVNVRSTYTLLPLAFPHIAKQKGGNIVVVSSLASRSGEPLMNPYQMSKAAIDCYTLNMAIKYGEKGVRVNAVNPGLVVTNLGSAYGVEQDAMQKVYRKYVEAKVPLRRMGRAEEIAETIVFLASDEASYVNGATWIADGGQLVARAKQKKVN